MSHDSTLVPGRSNLLALRKIQELNYNDFLGEPLASSLNQQFVLEDMEAFSRASHSKGVLRAATSLTQSLTARGLCIRLINLHIKNKAKSGTVTLTIVNCCSCHLPFKSNAARTGASDNFRGFSRQESNCHGFVLAQSATPCGRVGDKHVQ